MTPPPDIPAPTPFRRALLRWYRRNRRDLPWRRTSDAYAILVSELMLQQTQVSAVIPYYERFLKRFPTPAALAAAKEQDVLRLWAGLGYYRRARQLQQAAQRAVLDHEGKIPPRYEDLLALPGVGPYTAAAVASIAFGQTRAVVDGNVARVLCRLLAFGDTPRAGPAAARIQQAAQALLAPRAPGDFNQAMMELGALICRPASPQCPVCPVRALCRAFALGQQESFPVPAQRPKTKVVQEWAPLILRGGRLLMLQRPPDGPWAGMWEVPHVPALPGESPRHGLTRAARQLGGLSIEPAQPAFTITSAFTHHRIEFHCALAHPDPGAPRPPDSRPVRWVTPAQAARLPLPSAQKRIIHRMLDMRGFGTSGSRTSEQPPSTETPAAVAVPKPPDP
ncbi:MAG TPA: A/G-specific adenine glycosylase, partial [Candidatus Brocadiia bacterium]|nr:A/G-specific adenine glycosylase [Candidatus Brocadiia bacterium]